MEHFDWLLGFWMPNLNFVLFLIAGIYFFRKPLAKLALGRKESFLKLFDAAKVAKEEAEAKLAEVNKRLEGLDAEIREIKETASAGAQKEADRIVEDAKKLSEQMKKDSEVAAQAELARAQADLRAMIASNVQEEVTKKLKEGFGPEAQKAYQKKQIEKLSSINGWN